LALGSTGVSWALALVKYGSASWTCMMSMRAPEIRLSLSVTFQVPWMKGESTAADELLESSFRLK
jgi:hypothetical protein